MNRRSFIKIVGMGLALLGFKSFNKQEAFAQSSLPAIQGYGSPASNFEFDSDTITIWVSTVEELIAAFNETAKRIIRFSVGGEYLLPNTVHIVNPTIIVDGIDETVTLTVGKTFTIGGADSYDGPRMHHAVFRNLRIRQSANFNLRDCLTISKSSFVAIVNCSFTWGTDECVSIVNSNDVTMQDCLIAEGIRENNQLGSLIDESIYNISLIRCAYIHNKSRNPRIKRENGTIIDSAYVEMINCVVYNWGERAAVIAESSQVNLIGNKFIPGVDTRSDKPEIQLQNESDTLKQVYAYDNILENGFGSGLNTWQIEGIIGNSGHYYSVSELENNIARIDIPLPMPSNYASWILPAIDIESYIVANIGAMPRDSTDARILNELSTRTGSIKTEIPL